MKLGWNYWFESRMRHMGYFQYHKINEVRIVAALHYLGEMTITEIAEQLTGRQNDLTRTNESIKCLVRDNVINKGEAIKRGNSNVWYYSITKDQYEQFMLSLLDPKGRFENQ